MILNKKKFIFIKKNNNIFSQIKNHGIIKKKSYSNIALIKYWGKSKKDIQIPSNSSISYRLNNVYTITQLNYSWHKNKKNFSFKFFFAGKKNIFFYSKIKVFFQRILFYCSYLKKFNFIIKTYNNFPHSSGIGSSASSMSSIAIGIMELEKKLDSSLKESFLKKKASFLSRLGSGSACRSIYPRLSVWGVHKSIQGSNNLYAIPYPYMVHPIFKKIENTILIIDENSKYVSSSEGHELMKKHPYAKMKFQLANKNMNHLISVLKFGDFKKFGQIIEQEALNLHSMIMTSNPYYLWMKPNTVHVIQKIWDYRKKNNRNIYFTLDAGANIHLLYPVQEKIIILKWIQENLSFSYKRIIQNICLWN